MNNAIPKIKSTLEGTNSRIMEAEDRILLGLAKDIVTEDGADNNQDNGETGLQEALHYRPPCDAKDRHTCILLGNDAHGWNSKQGQQDCYDKSNDGTLITRHFKAHHQDNEQ